MSLLIPRLVVRERRPPPLRVSVGVEGWLRWELINRKGRVTRGGEQHNLILDQGLDQIAIYGVTLTGTGAIGVNNPTASIRYAAVGTDSTAPTTSDTGLGSEVGRTDVGSTGNTLDESISRSADGVYDHVRTYEFDFDEAIGNLTEWGISPIGTSGSNLYARELFRDGGGSPETVSKTADDKLRLVYTRRITITPTEWTAGSLAITNLGTVNGNYRLIGGDASGQEGFMDLRLFSRLAKAEEPTGSLTSWQGGIYLPPSDLSGSAYSDKIGPPSQVNIDTTTQWSITVHESADAYTPGSFTRDGYVLKFATNRGNYEGYGLALVGKGQDLQRTPRLGMIFSYDSGDRWTKDNLHELRVTLPTVTWGRGSS